MAIVNIIRYYAIVTTIQVSTGVLLQVDSALMLVDNSFLSTIISNIIQVLLTVESWLPVLLV